MRDLKGYMDFVGVSKKKYVDEWIDLNLIPGAVRDIEKGTYSFFDSSRRPYRSGALKAGLTADKLRSHIVKAAIKRQHITADACYMSPGEFDAMIDDLAEHDLVQKRIEDGVTYYDSTAKSDEYKNKSLKEIGKFVKDCLAVVAENAAKGAVEGAIAGAATVAEAA